MGSKSSFTLFILVFGVTFSLLYLASITDNANFVPVEPRISPLAALTVVEDDLNRKDLNSTDVILWFSQFNFTYPDDMDKEPHFPSFSEMRNHPELIRIPLFYVDKDDQTQYIVDIYEPVDPDNRYEVCQRSSDGCVGDPEAIRAISGKLAYRIELVRPFQGYYYIDALDGKILSIRFFQ